VWPRRVGWLPDLRRVRQARRRRVRHASAAAADTVAAHHRKHSGEPVQTGLPKRGQRWDGGQRCKAIHVHPKPERRLIVPAPPLMGTGTGSAVRWINLTTLLLRRFASFGRAAIHASVTRGATLYGSHPHEVSIRLPCLRGRIAHRCEPSANRIAMLQSGDRCRPCQLPKNRRCPRDSSLVPQADLTPPAAPQSHQGQAQILTPSSGSPPGSSPGPPLPTGRGPIGPENRLAALRDRGSDGRHPRVGHFTAKTRASRPNESSVCASLALLPGRIIAALKVGCSEATETRFFLASWPPSSYTNSPSSVATASFSSSLAFTRNSLAAALRCPPQPTLGPTCRRLGSLRKAGRGWGEKAPSVDSLGGLSPPASILMICCVIPFPSCHVSA